jgi:hypothetical protein
MKLFWKNQEPDTAGENHTTTRVIRHQEGGDESTHNITPLRRWVTQQDEEFSGFQSPPGKF